MKSTTPQSQGSGIKKYMQRRDDKVFPERLSVKDKRRDIIGRFSGTSVIFSETHTEQTCSLPDL